MSDSNQLTVENNLSLCLLLMHLMTDTALRAIQESYGQDHLHLTVVKGYLCKLITNDRVARYLAQYQPELFIEFQKIAEMTSTLPSDAA
jgi:hypothetical protein